MKLKICSLVLIAAITGCATEIPTQSPEARQAFSSAKNAVDKCLMRALGDLIETTNDPMILARVAATRCHGTALEQKQKLRKTKINQSVVDGFVGMLTDKKELMDRAMSLDLAARQSIIEDRKSKLK